MMAGRLRSKMALTRWYYFLLNASMAASVLAFMVPGNGSCPNMDSLFAGRHCQVPPRVSPASTKLYSLNKLVDDLITTKPTNGGPSVLFVGGKGGVGKTTISSALAVSLAASGGDRGDTKVLIVSTDPAHSLGDALDVELRRSRGQPVPMTDAVTGGKLWACEVDAGAALDKFRESFAAFDVTRLSQALGVSAELLESLGLREFSGLLNNPPPGLDELVALATVLDSDSVATSDFDVVVVDTAPTGHTLRLLALPEFLDGLLGKLIKLRVKLSKISDTLRSFFGDEQASQRAQTIDNAMDRLEMFRNKMAKLKASLKDESKTRFCVVTIPTKLAVAESKRLVTELDLQGVRVSDIVVNQCVQDMSTEDDANALEKYYERRKAGQDKWIAKLEAAAVEVSNSEEFRENGSADPITLSKIPYFDVELVGVAALGYLGSQCLQDNPGFAHLMKSDEGKAKVVIAGGKGGVGKTTTASALAVSMATKGHKVALISTDPAHSLGDAINMNLAGGELQNCPLIGVPPSDGSLSVLEIDPTSALKNFKGVVDKLVGKDMAASDSALKNTLDELQDVFNTLPAGTDEVVALAKIVNLVKKGGFDRIVLDTAPTGHTLRMLSTPSFIAELIDRLLAISDKINSNVALRIFLSSSSNREQYAEAVEESKSTLLTFQLQMYDLEDMFSNADQTEFVIVTVPTELAVRESTRLLNDLTFESPDMPIKVRNIVVNQVLSGDGSDFKAFIDQLSKGQTASMEELERAVAHFKSKPVITSARYLDTEPRGVYGLKILADELMAESPVTQTS